MDNIWRLIRILEAAEEIRRWEMMCKVQELLPWPGPPPPDDPIPAALLPLAKVLYAPPLPIVLEKNVPEPETMLAMVAAAREFCHRNLQYLDQIEKQIEAVAA